MFIMDDELYHYGTPRHSGRYPFGSGENPYQHTARGFLEECTRLKAEGLTEVEIAKGFGISTTSLRQQKALAKAEKRAEDIAHARALLEKGYSRNAVSEKLGIPESTIRGIMKEEAERKNRRIDNTAESLRQELEKKGMLDVGSGVNIEMGISEGTLKNALAKLQSEGYELHNITVKQPNDPDKETTIKVLAPPGTTQRDVWANRNGIGSVQNYLTDGGDSIQILKDPSSLSSSRVFIRYNEEGGNDRDGTIELRRGVDDLSLGSSHYAQVRIGVDGTHYMKGMAFYSDDIPDGYDIVYNTNKPVGTDKYKVFKPMEVNKETGEIDRSNPFKAAIKANGQYEYIDSDGVTRLSPLNKLREEGDWARYSKNISAQMLSKQPQKLIDRQLNLSMKEEQAELDSLKALTNPAVKKKLLQDYADQCDKKASDLKAAAFPRQSTQVILPVPGLKDDEIFAPNYKDGETVALVRYPHGGTFEIPVLRVNNKSDAGNKTLGKDIRDAVGITKTVADRLSGADFDGDTVIVIPTGSNGIKIKSTQALEGLKGFDPKAAYPKYDGMKVISSKSKQMEMGKVSNLITDMTLKGATPDELARAVRYSMVVIDAEKHKLNYKQAFKDNGIDALYKEYQGKSGGGASTLISKAGSPQYINQRRLVRENRGIDPETGALVYEETGAATKSGKLKTQVVSRMSLTSDARTLSSGTPQEEAYAAYANRLKSLANEARKEILATPSQKRSPSAVRAYHSEVQSLDAKLQVALKNAPRERQAQLLANVAIDAKKKANPDLRLKEHQDDLKKISSQELAKARARLGAKKQQIEITSDEWNAIQAGAVSQTKLEQILNNSNLDIVRQYATPKTSGTLSGAKETRLRAMRANGYTNAEIAEALGVSVSTVQKYGSADG